MLRLLRTALLVVLLFWILGLVVAIAQPQTGGLEDGILVAIVAGLFAVAIPVRRIGSATPEGAMAP